MQHTESSFWSAESRYLHAHGEGGEHQGRESPGTAKAGATGCEPYAVARRRRGGVRAQRVPRDDAEGGGGAGGVLRRVRLLILREQGRSVPPDLRAPRRGVHARASCPPPGREARSGRTTAGPRRLRDRVLPGASTLRPPVSALLERHDLVSRSRARHGDAGAVRGG